MTFYDDAEFAAIRATRIALAEHDGQPRSLEVAQVVTEMFERHGNGGVVALVVALARHNSAALASIAGLRDEDPAQVLDGFESHKLEQMEAESDG